MQDINFGVFSNFSGTLQYIISSMLVHHSFTAMISPEQLHRNYYLCFFSSFFPGSSMFRFNFHLENNYLYVSLLKSSRIYLVKHLLRHKQ